MRIWTIAGKDLRLLLRDPRALILLLAMPFLFIIILGLWVGEGFGQTPDNRLRVYLVDLDQGNRFALIREGMAGLAVTGDLSSRLGAASLASYNRELRPPNVSWAKVVQQDLAQTAEIKVETLDMEQARKLVRNSKVSAIIVFGPTFSEKVTVCSFLADGINPFYRDGVKLKEIDADVLRDPTQEASASIIEQVAQVTLLRVVLPWMIGRAFEKLSEPSFIDLLGKEVKLPSPFPLGRDKTIPLSSLLVLPEHKKAVGNGVQASVARLFPKYELTGKTWAALTKSEPRNDPGKDVQAYREEGTFAYGSIRYQTLVPSSMVMFAFFLVLTVGWLFVSEKRQGTLKRLQAAPLSRTEIILGKLLPCFGLSIVQGLVLLLAGKLAFGMNWGLHPLWLLPVVVTTSFAAMGMALFVAALARTETQVAIYGTLLVVVLALVSGCVMPRAMMPENVRALSLLTPHAWALDAYAQLLLNATDPNYMLVATACGVLTGFGLGFVSLAWWFLKLE